MRILFIVFTLCMLHFVMWKQRVAEGYYNGACRNTGAYNDNLGQYRVLMKGLSYLQQKRQKYPDKEADINILLLSLQKTLQGVQKPAGVVFNA